MTTLHYTVTMSARFYVRVTSRGVPVQPINGPKAQTPTPSRDVNIMDAAYGHRIVFSWRVKDRRRLPAVRHRAEMHAAMMNALEAREGTWAV
jgi:hypothetical protein